MASANATRALLKTRYPHSDFYVGTAQQLCAAKLAQPNQFPGQPGMPKVCATYFLVDGVPASHGGSSYERTYTVQRISASRYSVSVDVGEAEAERRKKFLDARHELPLDLPGTPVTDELQAPAWSPEGWAFRGRRKQEGDYVFVASAEQLKAHGLMEDRPLPAIQDKKRKTVCFASTRFGWVTVSQRAAATFFVALRTPNEIRYAASTSSDGVHAVRHTGTKEQLQAKRLGVGIGFPGEPGCKRRKVTTLHPETGNKVCIELLHCSVWLGEAPRFEVTVFRSDAEQKAVEESRRQAEAERQRMQSLKTLPATADSFRDGVADTFWVLASTTKTMMQAEDGYRFSDEAVEEFMDAISDAYWVLKEGDTTGQSPRAKLQQLLSAKARADAPLQRFLSAIRTGEAH